MDGCRLIIAVVIICALGAVSGAFANPELDTDSASDAAISADADTGIDTADDSPVNSADVEPDRPKRGKSGKKDRSAQTFQNAATETAAAPAAGKRAEKEVTEFRLSGVLEAGFDINNRVNDDRTDSRIIGKGTLEISARPVRKVRAEIGIEYDIRDTFIVVDKLYGQYSITKPGTIRAGIMKKSFGLEERAGVDERYFHRRSIINSELEDLGFLGHDLTLMYRHDFSKELRVTGGVSWSAEDSLRYLHNYSVSYDIGNTTQFVLAAIVMHNGDDDRWRPTSFVTSLSSRRETERHISELELTYGLSPYPRTWWTENREAYILGIRAQEQAPIRTPWSTLTQITPLVEVALYWEDFKESGNFDTQLRAGLVFGFAAKSAYQFRNTFEVRLRTNEEETVARRYRFDSQVVVVF